MIGIVYGGHSVESDVSIVSALQTAKSINIKKYNYTLIYVSKDNKFYIGKELESIDFYNNPDFKRVKEVIFQKESNALMIYKKIKIGKIIFLKKERIIDIICPIFHGYGYEDGVMSSYFELFDVPVCFSSRICLSIFQNKKYTKDILKLNQIKVIKGFRITESEFNEKRDEIIEKIQKYKYPVIIKPNNLGSSVGINIARSKEEIVRKILDTMKYDSEVLIEKYLNSYREFNCAIIRNNDYKISKIEEVLNNNQMYSYEDKYIKKTKKILNHELEENLRQEINNKTLKIAEIFNLDGLIRIDYLYDDINKELYVNEINGIPGSLSYYLFEEDDYLFSDLLEDIFDDAIKKHSQKNSKIKDINSKMLNNKTLDNHK